LNTALRLYFLGISRYPQLTRADEVALGAQIAAGHRAVLAAVVDSDVALNEFASLIEQIARGELDFAQFLAPSGFARAQDVSAGRRLAAVMTALERYRGVRDRPVGPRDGAARAALLASMEKLRLRWSALDELIVMVNRAAVDAGDHAATETSERLRSARQVAQKAQTTLVQTNLRLVVRIAKRYEKRSPNVTLPDLIQEGNLGLISAVQRFDHRLGHRFASYAGWWIRAAIAQAIMSQSNAIRIPTSVLLPRAQLRRAAQALALQLGRNASQEELALALDVPLAKSTACDAIPEYAVSLDAPLEPNGRFSLHDILEDSKHPSPYDHALESCFKSRLACALKSLDARERLVLAARYGLSGAHEETLGAVGAALGLSGERVRQLEAVALAKLGIEPPLTPERPESRELQPGRAESKRSTSAQSSSSSKGLSRIAAPNLRAASRTPASAKPLIRMTGTPQPAARRL
jgi:RNA polymerase primary sigma factor